MNYRPLEQKKLNRHMKTSERLIVWMIIQQKVKTR